MVAWRILWMTYQVRVDPNRSPTVAFSPLEISVLERVAATQQPTRPAGQSLTLTVDKKERAFFRRQLTGVLRSDGELSLLARLADANVAVAKADRPWHGSIRHVADVEDRRCLTLAKQSSALAGIGRAVYLALVEEAKNRDTQGNSRNFRDDLEHMRIEHGDDARTLDLPALHEQFPDLPGYLRHVLEETQRWLNSGSRDIHVLEDIYRDAEFHRKRMRARLGSALGPARRRAEWNTPQAPQPSAETLHYRWFSVRRLLRDLESG